MIREYTMKLLYGLPFLLIFIWCTDEKKDESEAAESSKAPTQESPLSDQELKAYQTCSIDTDCVYTHNGNCDCANGGKDAAINKEQLDAFRSLFAKGACTEVARIPPCGSGQVKCLDGFCTYIPVNE